MARHGPVKLTATGKRLELDTSHQLDVPGSAHRPVPHTEIRAADIGIVRRTAADIRTGEIVIIERVEGLDPNDEHQSLSNFGLFGEAYVDVLVRETAVVGDTRSYARVEVEVGGTLEGGGVEQRLVWIVMAQALREWALAWEKTGDARDTELARHVARARPEPEWCTGRILDRGCHLPAA